MAIKALFQIRDLFKQLQFNWNKINSNELVCLVGELEIEQMDKLCTIAKSSQQVPHIMSILNQSQIDNQQL